MDKPIYLGFAVLKFSKLLLYETYYDKLQPYFGAKNLHLQYLKTDSFILCVNTNYIIKDLKVLEDIFDFSNLDEKHEIFRNENKKSVRKFKTRTPKNLSIDKLVFLRSTIYSYFKCGDATKNKVKGTSRPQTTHIHF